MNIINIINIIKKPKIKKLNYNLIIVVYTIIIRLEMMRTLSSIVNEYACVRCDIENQHNGKMKLGCVAFSADIKHQCVLCVWDKSLQYT